MFIPQINNTNIYIKSYNTCSFGHKTTAENNNKIADNSAFYSTQITVEGRDLLLLNATEMFRRDINWKRFAEFLKEKFADSKKVNTYEYACSKGSESYSLSVLLNGIFPNDSSKFFPIIAKDLDKNIISDNIDEQKKGEISLASAAYQRAKECIGENALASLSKSRQNSNVCYLSQQVVDPIQYSQANIIQDIDSIDSKNPSIVMCRNMWFYVDQREFDDFAQKLYTKLAPGSIVVIGAIDYIKRNQDYHNFPEALINAGFKASGSKIHMNERHEFIFEK